MVLSPLLRDEGAEEIREDLTVGSKMDEAVQVWDNPEGSELMTSYS